MTIFGHIQKAIVALIVALIFPLGFSNECVVPVVAFHFDPLSRVLPHREMSSCCRRPQIGWHRSLSSSSSSSVNSVAPSHATELSETQGPTTTKTTIRICQNKHCRRRTQQDVVQTVHNLLDIPQQPSSSSSSQSSSSSSLSSIEIVSCGCLSQCDKGPNVEVEVEQTTSLAKYSASATTTSRRRTNSKTSLLMHGMKDAQGCAAQFNILATRPLLETSSEDLLRQSSDDDDDDDGEKEDTSSSSSSSSSSSLQNTPFSHLKPNKVLVAASKVIEQCQSLRTNEEKIRFLTSIIDTLDTKTDIQRSVVVATSTDTDAKVDATTSSQPPPPPPSSPQPLTMMINYRLSAVYHQAYALRAQTYVEMNRPDEAISDAKHVILTSSSSSLTSVTQVSITLSYRAWIDAEYLKLQNEEKEEQEQDNTDGDSDSPTDYDNNQDVMSRRLRMLLPRQRQKSLYDDVDPSRVSRIRTILQEWATRQPSYRLKIEEELKQLLE